VEHSEVVIFPSFFFMIGYLVWVLTTAWSRRQRLRMLTDFNTRLLDRLGSVKDFGEFLQTEAGARFMRELAAEPVSAGGPQDRILRAAQFGAVLGFLGIGLLFLSFFWSPYASERGQTVFATIGAIALSLGIGFAASAFISYRLAGALGVISRAAAPAGGSITSHAG
jgi:hypothetical protein